MPAPIPKRAGQVPYSVAWWPDGTIRHVLYRPAREAKDAARPPETEEPAITRRERRSSGQGQLL